MPIQKEIYAAMRKAIKKTAFHSMASLCFMAIYVLPLEGI